MNFDHFDQEEIYEALTKARDLNTDRKEIGDRVYILNYSSCTHLNGRPLDPDDGEEMQFNSFTFFIVIETRQDITYDAYFYEYKQDLVVVNPLTNKQYRINSGHVKLK
jgi:hypothetical protein